MAKEIPMLLSGPMVRAFIEGRKTQTRRLSNRFNVHPGDRIWFKETFGKTTTGTLYRSTGGTLGEVLGIKWKPSIFMPKSVCRCWAEIVEVREERLQNIGHAEALLEGCQDVQHAGHEFVRIWNSIHTKKGTKWEDNPTVFVFTFNKLKP